MKTIVFATENPGKIAEMRKFAKQFGVEILRPSEAGLQAVKVEETGSTYRDNARLKVEAYLDQPASKSLIICGDDSGIEIAALGGEPGLHTRRWLGYSMSDDEIVGYVLGRLHGEKNRTGVFKSTLAYSINGSPIRFVSGEVSGKIAEVPFDDASVQEGFPFRRIFTIDGPSPTPMWLFDQQSIQERSGLFSHREAAFKALFDILEKE